MTVFAFRSCMLTCQLEWISLVSKFRPEPIEAIMAVHTVCAKGQAMCLCKGGSSLVMAICADLCFKVSNIVAVAVGTLKRLVVRFELMRL